jgi:cysteine desulfurase / selenocysteine lyase
MLDPIQIQKDFPIFKRLINGKPLVFLDSASTSQKPKQVIDAISAFYEEHNANIHRGIYTLSEEATELYERSRKALRNFIHARSDQEIIFLRNTTEATNLVAYSWGEANISEGDEIIVSELEHHSNFVPWQQLCKRKSATLKIIPLKDDYTLDMEAYKQLLSPQTKLVAITGMSNVTGTIPDLKTIIEEAHIVGAKVLIDGAQSTSHSPSDVQKLDCDFLTISGHKMLAPTGAGALYVKQEILEEMPAFLTGGGMVKVVEDEETSFADIPSRFEAGTPNIASIVAFQAAVEYLENIGLDNIAAHETELLKYAIEKLSKVPGITLHSPAAQGIKAGAVLSFTLDCAHPHDIATILNQENVCIRAGHHCCQPLMRRLNTAATSRLSFYLYNSKEDVDKAAEALGKVIEIFA